MTKDALTIAVYNEQAADYAKFTSDAKSDPALSRFMNRLSSNGSVLDLGCGPGDHAAAMRDAGFRVTATDASWAMVEMARRHEGVQVHQASFEELVAVAAFDGIWANFSLLHATREEFPNYLTRVATALKHEGILHLGMKTGKRQARDKIGRHYAYYSAEELCRLLTDAGLEVIDKVAGEAEGLAGDVEPWLILTAKRILPA